MTITLKIQSVNKATTLDHVNFFINICLSLLFTLFFMYIFTSSFHLPTSILFFIFIFYSFFTSLFISVLLKTFYSIREPTLSIIFLLIVWISYLLLFQRNSQDYYEGTLIQYSGTFIVIFLIITTFIFTNYITNVLARRKYYPEVLKKEYSIVISILWTKIFMIPVIFFYL
ncbi:MAG: hypothetical protein HeimC3_00060 [Candidatus Heimdallarchaeota archaeon LC_3]|nr:MAG: hypothetical protein HeimC3_00060 [Candidatus Heimdallarchaeota archaeon LC_3]